ncbi:cell divisionFtsK/SpoIIIE [Methylobacterium sp. 4-46]|uniref:FtsK/SpoIIIE family DNA translocase n=1 Tax=unclassified Methylobacterium TaxID=2615210 RepID=UPI000165CDD5|nr:MULTISPECIES: DNA translocase FtsK [Methylobacterium]ACA19813.1 cell divisionFtsK/SpoIIIE [Methylobacterium sp. 4-46]WFT78998.1 DNA translocase FtsK [Methylobacterium nodulans]
MRSLRRSASPYDALVDTLRSFLKRRVTELAGLSLLLGAVAFVLALATWSIDDPSLNHATSRPARNLLGLVGAIVSDLGMQLIGFGSLALALPLAVWGVHLLRTHRLGRLRARLGLWLAGAGAASAVASALPPTARWPLPSGLGGVAGDGLLVAAKAVLGPLGAVAGFGFAAAAVICVTAACNLSEGDAEEDLDLDLPPPTRVAGRRPAGRRPAEEEGVGFGVASLDALAQLVLGARDHVARQVGTWRAARSGAVVDEADEASPALAARRAFAEGDEALWDESPAAPGRREPTFDDPRPAPAPPRAPAPEAAPRTRVAPPPAPLAGRRAPPPPQAEPGSYEMPAMALLAEPRSPAPSAAVSTDALEQNATLLESTLEDFGVRGEILAVRPGPVVTLYELEPAPGTKSSRVISLADDIARSMSAVSARVAVVQGRNAIGIELPNAKRETVYLREILSSPAFAETKQKLALCLGKNIGGEAIIADLARMPHLLVAGTTGSGKSVAINTMILSLLYRMKPEECRLIMVDPKMLELSVYDGIPHLLSPVVTDPKKAVIALKWAVREMEERYKKMSKLGVRNIDGFNARVAEARERGEVITRTVQTGFDRETGEAVYEDEVMDLGALPYIVVIVDEMADLMMVAGKDIEGAIQRLAQMARAAGIHLIMATQRPSVDVITGTIKANFPTRISFQVTSKIDSRTILGEMGAEQLLGQGDMLFMAGGGRTTRVHGPFVSDDEVEAVVAHLKRQGRPAYLDAITAEEGEEGGSEGDGAVFDQGSFGEPGGDVYEQAVAVVLRDKKASTSYIQRRLQIGYNRAASLMERMEKEGIVGPANHAGKREILVEAEDCDA